MKMKHTLITLFLLSSLLLAVDVTTIPAMKPPVLDGVLDTAEWGNTAKGGYVELRKGGKPSQPTEWHVGCDKSFDSR